MQLQKEAGKIDYVTKKAAKRPSKTERRELYRGCFNERDRALILVACTSSMALETLSNLRWLHFEGNWQSQQIPHVSVPSELIKGHGRGRYKGVRQETFITPEAKSELIKYREYMGKKGVNWTEDMNVFLSVEEPYHALTYAGIARTIRNISENSGVAFSVHDGRRIVETALENINVPRNWVQKVKGRKVRGEDAPYSKPAVEQLRQKYREALPELEFLAAEVEEHIIETRIEERTKEQTQQIQELKTRLETLEKREAERRRDLGIPSWDDMTEGQQKAALEFLEVATKLSKEEKGG
jgi:hypothetical protein